MHNTSEQRNFKIKASRLKQSIDHLIFSDLIRIDVQKEGWFFSNTDSSKTAHAEIFLPHQFFLEYCPQDIDNYSLQMSKNYLGNVLPELNDSLITIQITNEILKIIDNTGFCILQNMLSIVQTKLLRLVKPTDVPQVQIPIPELQKGIKRIVTDEKNIRFFLKKDADTFSYLGGASRDGYTKVWYKLPTFIVLPNKDQIIDVNILNCLSKLPSSYKTKKLNCSLYFKPNFLMINIDLDEGINGFYINGYFASKDI